jgi:hypothetical protein
MGPKLAWAGCALAEAIGAGDVHAWGRRTRDALHEKIDSSQFRISGLPLVVSPHGELTTLRPHLIVTIYQGIRWRDIEVDPDKLKEAFPPHEPVSEASEAPRYIERYSDWVKRAFPAPDPATDKPAQLDESPLQEEEAAGAERTRWQRDRLIPKMKEFYRDGIRPKGISIARWTKSIKTDPEFQDVSEDTVRLADLELKVMAVAKRLNPPTGIRPKDITLATWTKRINKEPEFQGRRKPVDEDTVQNADIYLRADLQK